MAAVDSTRMHYLAGLDKSQRTDYDQLCGELGFDPFSQAREISPHDFEQWINYILKLRTKGRFSALGLTSEGKEVLAQRFHAATAKAQLATTVTDMVIKSYLVPRGTFGITVMQQVIQRERAIIKEEQALQAKRSQEALAAVARANGRSEAKLSTMIVGKDTVVTSISTVKVSANSSSQA